MDFVLFMIWFAHPRELLMPAEAVPWHDLVARWPVAGAGSLLRCKGSHQEKRGPRPVKVGTPELLGADLVPELEPLSLY